MQAAHQRNIGPLLSHEITTIDEQLRFMGKQPKRWELIISHHLPYRTVGHLSKLWAAHQAVLQQTAPGVHALAILTTCWHPVEASAR